MVLITPEKCKEPNINIVTMQNSDLFWMKMIEVQHGLDCMFLSCHVRVSE